jgi:hypothetical protein
MNAPGALGAPQAPSSAAACRRFGIGNRSTRPPGSAGVVCNFPPMPISTGTVFCSKAVSLCVFVVLFSLFVNAFPALLYPLFVSRTFQEAARFIFSHALAVSAGNAFIFLTCVTVQGLLLNALGPRLFAGVSRLVQLFLLVFLLTVFFLMPSVSIESMRQNPFLLDVFAPAWFLGLYQTLLAGPTAEFIPLARRALAALGLAGLGFVLSYVLAYKRQLRKTLEIGPAVSRIRMGMGGVAPRCASWLLILRNPRERASFSFTAKTLARSPAHRTCFAAYAGAGLAFVLMSLMTVYARHGFQAAYQVRPELLSIPLVMSFFVLLGLRVAFSIPTHLGANWMFRLTDGDDLSGSLSGVRKAMVLIGVLPLLAVLFPVYLGLWGWQISCVHMAYCATLSLLLIEVLVFRLDKMPFTSPYTPGRANLKLWWWAYLFGFTNYAYSMTELELMLLRQPRLFTLFFAACLALLLIATACRNRLIGRLTAFRYEADAAPAPEPLILSGKPF